MGTKDTEEAQLVFEALLRDDFVSFIHKVFTTLNPGTVFQPNWHHDVMAYELVRLKKGENKRLIITIPPRHLKSISTSVAWVAWTLGHSPDARFICVSYGDELAIKLSNDTRKVMMSDWYQRVFPKAIISDKKNTEAYFETTEGGFRLATTVKGSLTGMGGDYMIIDDPHKADDAHSPTKLLSTVNWFKETAMSRLDSPKEGVIVVVQQRFHQEDLAGSLLESGGWMHLNMPAIMQQDVQFRFNDESLYNLKKGDVLHEESMSLADLRQRESEMGASAFAAQYLQLPGPVGGEIVKLGWFKRYYGELTPQIDDHIIQSWDFAYVPGAANDYTVCMTWLYRDFRFYLLHIYRNKVKGSDLVSLIRAHSNNWNAGLVIMEGTGPGALVYDELAKLESHKYRYHNPTASKEVRLHTHANAVESGRFYLPHDESWLPAFERELQYFPKGRHDDQVDALSQTMYLTSVYGLGCELIAPAGMFPDPRSEDPETDPYAYIGK